jgi:hypothetical protein
MENNIHVESSCIQNTLIDWVNVIIDEIPTIIRHVPYRIFINFENSTKTISTLLSRIRQR